MSAVHYDIGQMRDRYEADCARSLRIALTMATTEQDRRWVRLQARFNNLIFEAMSTCAVVQMEGHDRVEIAKALGVAVGRLRSSFLSSNPNNIEAQVAFLETCQRVTVGMLLGDLEGAIMSETSVSPVPGGHA